MRTVPLFVLLAAGGCIWTPNNRTEREKGGTLTVSGYVHEANSSLTLKARNYETGALDTIATPTSGATEAYPGAGMYPWSASLNTTTMNAKYWAPLLLGNLSAGTSAPGRLELAAFNVENTRMVTFTEAAADCVSDEMNDGEDMSPAGGACYDGREVVLYENTGIGQGADANDNWTLMPGGAGSDATIRWDVVKYLSQGLEVYGLVCRPTAAGSYPVHVYNHGGYAGMGPNEIDGCKVWATAGWVFVAPTYRGERMYYDWVNYYPSQGNVEFCLGEVTDSLRMLEVLDNMVASADMNRVLMSGHSHGGCVTTRAVERGAPVQAAIDIYGPSDWGLVHGECADCAVVKTDLETATGGTPATRPLAYNWRSPRYKDAVSSLFAGDLAARSDVKFMIQHGVDDTLVPVNQSCLLAQDAWDTTSARWHVTAGGVHTTNAVAGCSQSWTNSARPTTVWSGNRYLLVYDAIGHAVNYYMWLDYTRFVNALGWATPFPT